ncbi:DNA repair protein RadA [Microbacterium imperiale]|uniref:DNA repair protein RadA n=1 Tax=Microbacterium imperiale TaxID=33884 RepID=A0A9W6M4J9_9MICO|nr:DNA repair protein RadA [Microbacterium imperiale]MBP2420844.1 DNA repair protein RadA/Sms [Microbacterium imperiale]MDS0200041.1 DNA repair protein RadA [Microbacterium imperiale]BFE41186.1 DNA repair protein RadA [Microbacterium imperiale]GLJ81240.1 DNA repair protein RadA [Microbacterium imperiale]
MASRRPSPTTAFRCTECGWTTAKWVGRCGECQQWGTVVEAATQTGITTSVTAVSPGAARAARPITEIDTSEAPRRSSGVGEFDRVLGGGVVPGAAILLSGEPGVGKSTLLLEVAAQSARSGRRVLYVSAEESLGQVRLRAERTGALHDALYLASETDLATVLGHIDDVQPELLIVDSVQTVSSALSDGVAGHPSQVREVASTLIRVAKERNLPVLIVGHVTKDGSIAGPRVLEHLVDVVCQFEGDRQTSLRFVRALKNRFGPTDEVGCFDMAGDGIAEVPDPSALFLGHGDPVPGTCVTIALEGRRALPVEVQALTLKTGAPNPRRVVSGVDSARVAMILAVLEKRGVAVTSDQDVYVSTVGGVRLVEPAADLAIAIAIAGAVGGRAVSRQVAAFGELSLAGEIRPVTQSAQRQSEAKRMGYRAVVDASSRTIGGAMRDLQVRQPAASTEDAPDF